MFLKFKYRFLSLNIQYKITRKLIRRSEKTKFRRKKTLFKITIGDMPYYHKLNKDTDLRDHSPHLFGIILGFPCVHDLRGTESWSTGALSQKFARGC